MAGKSEKTKTAVVVIHGMGEQWPMETLRGFVDAVWSTDAEVVDRPVNQIWSKPDSITGSFELRRITTAPLRDEPDRRVDFFEFYWAHLMQGNSLGAVISWVARLMLRRPERVPARLKPLWWLGLALLAAVLALAVASTFKGSLEPFIPGFVFTAVGLVGTAVATVWLKPVAGDAARYLSPAPGNVAARQAIREAGLDLLRKLHESGAYDRIVLVGHSLGTVVGYDVLHYAWGRLSPADLKRAHAPRSPAMGTLKALEDLAPALEGAAPHGPARTAWRAAQRTYFRDLSKAVDDKGVPLWLVSDFVTLGCPLSSADVLLAKDADDLAVRKTLRDMPTCPPKLEVKDPPRFSYPSDDKSSRIPHHAAAFAPTVWTNVWFPHFGLAGDLVSGPVAPQLGQGVRDVRVPIGGLRFRHLDYWRDPAKDPPWIRALRRAVNLRHRREGELWGEQVDSEMIAAEKLPASGSGKAGGA